MMTDLQIGYYVLSIVLMAAGIGKSAYNGSLRRIYKNVNRIEDIETSVGTIQEQQDSIQSDLEESAHKQERLIAGVVALANYPNRVSPSQIEKLLTEDQNNPSPTDFFDNQTTTGGKWSASTDNEAGGGSHQSWRPPGEDD